MARRPSPPRTSTASDESYRSRDFGEFYLALSRCGTGSSWIRCSANFYPPAGKALAANTGRTMEESTVGPNLSEAWSRGPTHPPNWSPLNRSPTSPPPAPTSPSPCAPSSRRGFPPSARNTLRPTPTTIPPHRSNAERHPVPRPVNRRCMRLSSKPRLWRGHQGVLTRTLARPRSLEPSPSFFSHVSDAVPTKPRSASTYHERSKAGTLLASASLKPRALHRTISGTEINPGRVS